MNSRNVRFARTIAVALLLTSATTTLLPAVPAQAAPVVRAATMREGKESTLLRAVTEGSAEKLMTALTAGEDVNSADKNGKTALMYAASLGRTDLVQTLLEKKADVNLRDSEGRTALHYVLAGASQEAPQKKRGFGGFVDKAKGVGGKALTLLANAGPLSMFLPGGPLLQNLAQGMMGRGLTGMLGPGASFGLGSAGGWTGVLGSALMNGTGKAGAAPVLGALDGVLKPGAAPTELASSWGTLLKSAGSKQPDLYKAMGNLGADATEAERTAWSTFLKAAQAGDEEAMQKMVADPEFAPILQKATTGLKAAADILPGRDGGAAITTALLAHGADASLADKNGQTPLQRAQAAKLDVVARLLGQTVAAKDAKEEPKL